MKPILTLLLAGLTMPVFAQTPAKNDKQLFAEFDKLLNQSFPAQGTGATALVARKGEIIYKKAFGKANLELDVAMRPEMVFRIGSITKQFTAVAILKLMEQGRLSLQDEITKHIPDYPMQGQKITIEHLLTHTSGIQSYTSMEKWTAAVHRNAMTTTELINFFKNEPMNFVPGEKFLYNNSGYILLGYIIEKISGKNYGEFIKTEIFQPLGMSNSCYDSTHLIIKNRAAGYEPNDQGKPQNADYLSMTQPHAAGGLLSTVEDLYKWNRGLYSSKIVRRETLDRAFRPYLLKNGESTHYGYGWTVTELEDSYCLEHSGGINGFLSNAMYFPQEDVFVAVLSNCTCIPPNDVSMQVAAWAINKPFNFVPMVMDATALKEYVAIFEHKEFGERIITKDGDKLYSQRTGNIRYALFPYKKDKFSYEGSPMSTLEFLRDRTGKIISVVSKSGSAPEVIWLLSKKPIPVERKVVTLDAKLLADYVGDYELTPSFILNISNKDGQLFAKVTGQSALAIFAEKEGAFFYKEVDAHMEFVRDSAGKISHVMFHQGGRDVKGNKR